MRETVIKIATFLGYQLSDDVISRIVEHCTFANMRKNPQTNPDMFLREAVSESQTGPDLGTETVDGEVPKSFMRKGIYRVCQKRRNMKR